MSVSIDPTATVSDPLWATSPDGTETGVFIGDLALESGAGLADVTVTFQKWGTPNAARDNVILALHALTGNSHVTGPIDEQYTMAGWWDGLVGPGLAIDTDEWCVLAPNAIGGCFGSTGPGSPAPDGRPWGSRFPRLTVRDLVHAEADAFAALGITRFAAVAGGSMGGARALEWAVTYPERVGTALVLAVGARASADQIGTQTTQIAAITSDPDWQGGDYHGTGRSPSTGMGIARRIAHLSYRSDRALDERFENLPPGVTQEPITIPTGVNHGSIILEAAEDAPIGASLVHLQGRATIKGEDGKEREIVRRAIITGDPAGAARELRGTDGQLDQLLERRPPEFEIRVAEDIEAPEGFVAIEIVGMNKWYGQFHVLRDINLTVRQGEVVGIGGDVAHEHLVNLDVVDVETLEIGH